MQARTTVLLIGALALATLCPALAQEEPPPPPVEKTYTLQMKPSIGDLLRYRMQMDMKMDLKSEKGELPIPTPVEGGMSGTMRLKTVGIKPDGAAVVVVEIREGALTAMGNTIPFPEMPPVTLEMDRLGKVLKVRDAGKIPGGTMFSQWMNFSQMPIQGVVLPDRPVRIGDSWETEIPFPISDQKVRVVTTLIGLETVGGQETLKIKQVMTVPVDMKLDQTGQPTKDTSRTMTTMTGEVSINSIANVLERNARLVKLVGDADARLAVESKSPAAEQSPFGSQMNMTMGMRMTMSLISAGKVQAPPKTKDKRRTPSDR